MGASKHFLTERDQHLLQNPTPIFNGLTAMLPNRQILNPSITGNLPISKLSSNATSSYVYPGLTNSSLLYLGQLCDDDCTAVLSKHFMHIYKDNQLLIKGYRNWKDGLWDIPFPHVSVQSQTKTLPQHSSNFIVHKDQTKHSLAQYIKGMFIPCTNIYNSNSS